MASSSTATTPPTPEADLGSLLEYTGRIREWTANKSFADYRQDTMLSSAVEREFIEVGNIIRRLELNAPHLHRQIPKANKWYAFRIRLDHIRWEIKPDIVWQTIQQDMPELVQAAADLLTTNR